MFNFNNYGWSNKLFFATGSSSAGPSNANLVQHFLWMGFFEKLVIQAINENVYAGLAGLFALLPVLGGNSGIIQGMESMGRLLQVEMSFVSVESFHKTTGSALLLDPRTCCWTLEGGDEIIPKTKTVMNQLRRVKGVVELSSARLLLKV